VQRISLLGGLLLLACHAAPSAEGAVPVPDVSDAPHETGAPVAESSEEPSAFHLAFRGPGDTSLGELAPSGSLCPTRGRVFVCGLGEVLVDEDGIRRDESLESGLVRTPEGYLDGDVDMIVGSFPDDAWLVQAVSRSNPAIPYRIYQWRASRWVARATLDAMDLEVSPSAAGLLLEWTSLEDKSLVARRRDLVPSQAGATRRLLGSRTTRKLSPEGGEVFDAGPPPPAVSVSSYAREDSGVEWVVGADHAYLPKNTLWRRRSGGWELVPAPALAAGAEPKRVWAVGGEVWLLVWYEGAPHYFAALFRTGPR
jgi:hypothetical protein